MNDENGVNSIKDEFDILNEIKKYHEHISKSQLSPVNVNSKVNDYLKDINHAVLSEQDKEYCEMKLSLDEIGVALSSLNNDSAPGIDGLPVSWYKVFYNKIKFPLFQCLNQCIITGELSISQRRGVITLIHKGKNLDRYSLKNWRPISLTTTDYKIFSKCIANRLQKILPSIIHTTQSGFVKGRSIVDHIRLIDDIINLSRQHNMPGMIVSLDYQKAFDSIEKSSIISALQKFNFGSNFINLVNTLINKTESCVQNGGWLSGFFDVERGIRQGCCVSPILFIIVAELMSIKIRNNENVNGLSFNSVNKVSKQIKLLQYADDTTLLLKSKNDLQNAINDVKNFSNISGLILNEQKSIGMWLGGSIERTDFPENVSWAKRGENIRILGIFFNSEIEASNIDLNWKARIQNIEKIIVKLHKQNSSLYGKILLCKTYLLSQVSFILQTLSLPNDVLNKIDTLFFKFIWQKSFSNKKAREKIKRSVLCKPYIEGGLDMIRCRDQQKVFLLKWMQKIISNNDSLYKSSDLADVFFSPVGGINYILSFSSISEKMKESFNFSRFWQDIMTTWVYFQTKNNDYLIMDINISKEPLFNNKSINLNDKPIFYVNWVKADILYMGDLFKNGDFLSFEYIKNKIPPYPGLLIDYIALIKAIPTDWIKSLRNSSISQEMSSQQYHINFNKNNALKVLSISNKKLRQAVVDITSTDICGRNFWKNKLGFDIYCLYGMAFNATRESKLRLLHFKILHNIYPSNILLNRMGLRASELCDHCGLKDVIEHMFIHCEVLNGFWDKVFKTIFLFTNVHFDRSDFSILFGFAYNSNIRKNKTNIANHILLIAKLCVSKMRYGESKNINVIFESELSLREKYLRY